MNGTVMLSGHALESWATSGALIQTVGEDNMGANGNDTGLKITGDQNRFGIYQGGRQNSVGTIVLEGSGNQMGVRQEGCQNDLTVSIVSGNSNDVGIA